MTEYGASFTTAGPAPFQNDLIPSFRTILVAQSATPEYSPGNAFCMRLLTTSAGQDIATAVVALCGGREYCCVSKRVGALVADGNKKTRLECGSHLGVKANGLITRRRQTVLGAVIQWLQLFG